MKIRCRWRWSEFLIGCHVFGSELRIYFLFFSVFFKFQSRQNLHIALIWLTLWPIIFPAYLVAQIPPIKRYLGWRISRHEFRKILENKHDRSRCDNWVVENQDGFLLMASCPFCPDAVKDKITTFDEVYWNSIKNKQSIDESRKLATEEAQKSSSYCQRSAL